MPNTILTQTKIREEVSSRLGSTRIDIEIDQSDLDAATAEAVRQYTRYRPQIRRARLTATTSQKRYVLSTVDHPGLVGVIDVQTISRTTDPTAIDPFNPYDSGITGGLMVGDETFGDINQRIIFSKDASRVVSAEFEWFAQWEGSEFALYVDMIRASTLVSYQWTSNYTPDTNADTGMLRIPDPDTDWILDYIEARCMVTVGRIRRKFGGIPNSDGGQDEVDGQQLTDEGTTKMTDLLETLRSRTIPIPPSIE